MIAGVAVIPTTALLLDDIPGRRHPQLATLAAQVRDTLDQSGPVDVAVALAGATDLAVFDAPGTDLSGYGLTDLAVHPLNAGPAGVVASLHDAVTHCRGGRGRHTAAVDVSVAASLDLSVLLRHLSKGTPTVGLTVPPDLGVAGAQTLGQAISSLAADHDVLLVVAGDLGAGHGTKPPRPDAAQASTAFDQQVVAALDNGRPEDLVNLDFGLSAAAEARATGALRVLGAVLEDAKIRTVVRANIAPLGVGYVVASG